MIRWTAWLLTLACICSSLAPLAIGAAKKKPAKSAAAAEPESAMATKLVPDEFILQLSLNSDQKTRYERFSRDFESKVGDAVQKLADAREGNHDRASLQKVAEDEKQIKEAADKLRAELEAKVMSLLNPEQKVKLESLKKAYPADAASVAKKKGTEKGDSKKPKKPK